MSDYRFPNRCEKCGSDRIIVRVLYDKGITRYICQECDFARSLPKEENIERRTSTPLTHWRQRHLTKQPFCAICRTKKNLEVHHIIPVSHSEDYKLDDNNAITLCKYHHWLVHNKELEEQRW